MRRLVLLLLAGAALAVTMPSLLAAAPRVTPGASDPSFGRNGFLYSSDVLAGIGEDGTGFDRLRLLPDGAMVVSSVERCSMSCRAGLLSRFTPEGGFLSTTRYVVTSDEGTSVSDGALVRPDGGLVISTSDVGRDDGSPPMRRYLRIVEPDGTAREVDLAGHFTPWSVMADGGLVGLSDRLLARLGPSLAPDPAFGAGGTAVVPALLVTFGEVAATTSTIRLSGVDESGLSLARFDLAGRALTTARIPVSIPGLRDVDPARLVVRRDGHAFVVARVWLAQPDDAQIMRTVIGAFLPDGRVDRSFGRHGLLQVAQADAAIAFQRDGRMVVAGSSASRTSPDSGAHIILRRLTTTGRPDPTFPTRRIRVRPAWFAGLDVAVDRRDRIVVAGGAFAGYGGSGVMFARFLTGSGAGR